MNLSIIVTKNQDLDNRILQLHNLYSVIPHTSCKKVSCADWCCSKLKESMDEYGNFMSLPLIYNIEYYAIAAYIEKNFIASEKEKLFSVEKNGAKCVFRKSDPPAGCMIYPVRPFSCRVYGRKTPDFFWGIDYPQGCAQSIYCPDCEPEDINAETRFMEKSYHFIWRELEKLSKGLKVCPQECEDVFRKTTGLNELLVLGWIERNELMNRNKNWYETQFEQWWKIYSVLF